GSLESASDRFSIAPDASQEDGHVRPGYAPRAAVLIDCYAAKRLRGLYNVLGLLVGVVERQCDDVARLIILHALCLHCLGKSVRVLFDKGAACLPVARPGRVVLSKWPPFAPVVARGES